MNWFEGWTSLLTITLFATLVYVALILMHRIVGKRAASKMNNFDWIVTVAVGTIAGSTILSESVSLAEGLLAVAVLLALQYAATKVSSLWTWFHRLIYADPKLIFYEGTFLTKPMRAERISRSEILAAAREAGLRSLDEVAAVVLESDGTLSVITAPDEQRRGLQTPPLLSNVAGLPDYAPPRDGPGGETGASRR